MALVALGRKAEPRQRAGHDFRRGGLEVEQEAQRVRQIEVGEVLQDLAFYPPVEQARQDRTAEEHLPAFWIQLQHRGCEAREHHACDARIDGGEQRRHVTELLLERLCRRRVSASSSVRRKSIEASDDGSSTSSARSTRETDENLVAGRSSLTQPLSGG